MPGNLKTEHCGPKKGNGNFWGRKKLAKRLSNKKRRAVDKRQVSENTQAR
jgi:hypothetical protein